MLHENHIMIDDIAFRDVLTRRNNIAAISKMIDTTIWLIENGYYKEYLSKEMAMDKIGDYVDKLKLEQRKTIT